MSHVVNLLEAMTEKDAELESLVRLLLAWCGLLTLAAAAALAACVSLGRRLRRAAAKGGA